MADFGKTQTGRVGGGQQGPGTDVPGMGEQTADFLASEDLRQGVGDLGHRDVEGDFPLAKDTEKRKRMAQEPWLTLA